MHNGNGFCSIEKIVRLQRDFLWVNVTGGRKIAMVSWEKICIPREKGRLGVKDISIFNKAFLT